MDKNVRRSIKNCWALALCHFVVVLLTSVWCSVITPLKTRKRLWTNSPCATFEKAALSFFIIIIQDEGRSILTKTVNQQQQENHGDLVRRGSRQATARDLL